MPQGGGTAYTFDHRAEADGSLRFACSTDKDAFPWLALPPQHPIVVQTQNFWASFGALTALGELEPGQWSALVWTDWECGDPAADHAVSGIYDRTMVDGHDCFRLRLFDHEDRSVVTMRGRGVVFRNRNFEEWRTQSKVEAAEAGSGPGFEFADRSALGLSSDEHPFVASLDASADSMIEGLISRENGLPPNNPMVGGSGDHVNSTHIAEAARQALCLIEDNPVIEVTGGEMHLNRYVELGTPFRLRCVERKSSAIRFSLSQLDRDCSEITLRW